MGKKKIIVGIIAGVLVIALAVVGIAEITGNSFFEKETEDVEDAEYEDEEDSVNDFETVGTRDARTKTCLDNQREIQAQFNNNATSGILQVQDGDTYELRTDEDGTGGEWVYTGSNDNDQTEMIYQLFQDVPYCPVGGNVIKVSINDVEINEYDILNARIFVECCGEHETHSRTE